MERGDFRVRKKGRLWIVGSQIYERSLTFSPTTPVTYISRSLRLALFSFELVSTGTIRTYPGHSLEYIACMCSVIPDPVMPYVCSQPPIVRGGYVGPSRKPRNIQPQNISPRGTAIITRHGVTRAHEQSQGDRDASALPNFKRKSPITRNPQATSTIPQDRLWLRKT